MEILIYAKIKDMWNLSDEFVMSLFDQMEMEEKAKTVFKDGSILRRGEFLEAMQSKGNSLFIGIEKKKPICIVWLNRFESRFARWHFCGFRGCKPIQNGKEILNFILTQKDKNGYLLDMVVGYCPKDNEKANYLTQKLGGQKVGELPFGVWDYQKEKSKTVIIYYLTRSEL